MSENSSEEEDVSKFLEAVDIKLTQAFSNFVPPKSGTGKKNFDVCNEILPSMRKSQEENNFSSNHLALQVTPEFQKFVAKKLEKSLDRYLHGIIDENIPMMETKKKSKKSNQCTGIKLFKSSSEIVIEFKNETDDVDNRVRKHNRLDCKRNIYEYDEKEEMKKIKMVVVEPDVVLSGSETKAWSKQVKGDILRVGKTKIRNEYSIKHDGYIPPENWTGRMIR